MIYNIMEFHHESILSCQKLRFEFPQSEVGILHPHIRLQPTRNQTSEKWSKSNMKPTTSWMDDYGWLDDPSTLFLCRELSRAPEVSAGKPLPAHLRVAERLPWVVWRQPGPRWMPSRCGVCFPDSGDVFRFCWDSISGLTDFVLYRFGMICKFVSRPVGPGCSLKDSKDYE